MPSYRVTIKAKVPPTSNDRSAIVCTSSFTCPGENLRTELNGELQGVERQGGDVVSIEVVEA